MNQKEFFGLNSIENLKAILEKENPKKIFLVSGNKSYEKSGAKEILFRYLKNYNFIHFYDFSTIPLIEDVKKGIDIFQKEKCDLIIAVGGGSVIDVAKLINIFSVNKVNLIDTVQNFLNLEKSGKSLIAIPTTSGSGSEATHFAVLYVKEKKFSITSPHILPTYAIVDPKFTKSLSSKLTAISGMDALSQATESFWSLHSTTISQNFSKESIDLILKNLSNAVNNPTEKTRLSMAKASNLAGKAINITKTTAPHAISYPLTYFFDIPHGHAVCLTLGEFFIFNSHINKFNFNSIKNLEEYFSKFSELLEIFDVTDSLSAKQKISQLMSEINLETKLSNFNISKKDLPLILNNINIERLNNNPRKISREDLKLILTSII